MNIDDLYSKYLESSGVTTDTRKDLKRKVFFALRGNNFNGNEYAIKALEDGALYAVVDEPISIDDKDRIIQVKDVLSTLQQLATVHRRKLGIPIIGITGSNGKTTSKELIFEVLRRKYKVFATRGNFNNHIGVPLSILEITIEHELAIIEMGANKINDIKELSEICEPDFGIITNIGNAHLEGFGGKNGVIKAKRALFDYVIRHNNTIFVNSSEKEVVEIAGEYANQITIGEDENSDYIFQMKESEPNVNFSCIKPSEFEVKAKLYGVHNYQNLKMAAAIGLYFKVGIEQIKIALKNYKSENNRSQIINIQGVEVYLDAYNANPSSMSMALNSFSKLKVEKSLVILGDMLELGEDADIFHLEIINQVNLLATEAIFIGPLFSRHKDLFNQHVFLENIEMVNKLKPVQLKNYNAILIKGSRSMQLEKIYFLN